MSSELERAAYLGNFEKVRSILVQRKKELNKALIDASDNGRLDIIQYLLSEGADIHYLNDSPLFIAAANVNIKIVQYLLSQGANINALHQNDDGPESALSIATYNYFDPQTVQYLLSHGADPSIILNNPSIYRPDVVQDIEDFVYNQQYIRPLQQQIGQQIRYAPPFYFANLPQGGIFYQNNPYAQQIRRIGGEIESAPPNYQRNLPQGGVGYQETSDYFQEQYPDLDKVHPGWSLTNP